MRIVMALSVVLIVTSCANTQHRMTTLEQDRADCTRLGGRLEVQPKEVYCHLPNGEVRDGLDLILD